MEKEKKCLPILDWSSIETLRFGNRLQQSSLVAIESLGCKNILRTYSPQLIGDIALGIDSSDPNLKIILSSYDLAETEKILKEKFWNRAALKIERRPINGVMSILISFTYNQFTVKLSAQMAPVATQRAYKVFRGQLKLLAMVGYSAISAVEKLKEKGLKTEWAVAEYFLLNGDPRDALFKIDDYDEVELRAFLLEWKNGSKIEPEPIELTVTTVPVTSVPGTNGEQEFKIEMEKPQILFKGPLRR